MTLQAQLKIDKLEISMRLKQNDFDTLNFIQDILAMYVGRGEGRFEGRNRYPNNGRSSKRYTIYLLPNGRYNLSVEVGVATARNAKQYPYVKFSFNVQRIGWYREAKMRLLTVLGELSTSGGYTDLPDDGYVLYVEFSADFRGVEVESIDAYCPKLHNYQYFPGNSVIKTINLHDKRRGRPEAFCIYDKKLEDRVKHRRIRRGPLLRIESRRRFNRTPTYRQLHLEELHSIPNPFRGLRVYDREQIESTFTAARHTNFLAHVRTQGVQAALSGTRGADRDRRERMLDESCRVGWWDPDRVWAGRHNAINAVLALWKGFPRTSFH